MLSGAVLNWRSDVLEGECISTDRQCGLGYRYKVLVEEPSTAWLLKISPAFYGTRKFITVFTRARHWSISWARSIQFIPPHLINLSFSLILSDHLQMCLLPSGFPTEIIFAFLFVPIRTVWPAHLFLIDLIILIILGEGYKSWSSSLFSFLYLLSPHPCSVQIFFSTPSVYVLLLMSEIKFYTHTEPQTKL
jgi:hypothetical protein